MVQAEWGWHCLQIPPPPAPAFLWAEWKQRCWLISWKSRMPSLHWNKLIKKVYKRRQWHWGRAWSTYWDRSIGSREPLWMRCGALFIINNTKEKMEPLRLFLHSILSFCCLQIKRLLPRESCQSSTTCPPCTTIAGKLTRSFMDLKPPWNMCWYN